MLLDDWDGDGAVAAASWASELQWHKAVQFRINCDRGTGHDILSNVSGDRGCVRAAPIRLA